MNLRAESERLASSRRRVTQVHACACVCVCACVCRHLCVVHARVCVCAHRGHMPAAQGVNGMLFMQVCVCVYVRACECVPVYGELEGPLRPRPFLSVR